MPCGAGSDEHAQGHGGVAVGGERVEPAAVGAQHVGEQVGVEAVVLVAGGAVAGAQCGDLAGGDDEHGQAGLEQGRDDRAVTAFDRDTGDLVTVQQRDQLAQAGRGVIDGASFEGGAGVVDDADGVCSDHDQSTPAHVTGTSSVLGALSVLVVSGVGWCTVDRSRPGSASPVGRGCR